MSAPSKEAGLSSSSPRQRARRTETDEKIAQGVFEVLRTRGFNGLTIDSVAAVSGVAKTTIYRRYDDRIDMLRGVIDSQPIKLQDDYAYSPAGLRELLSDCYSQLQESGDVRAVIGLAAAQTAEIEELRQQLVDPSLDKVRVFFTGAMAEGALRGDIDIQQVIELALGGIVLGSANRGRLDDQWFDGLVDLSRSIWAND